jgi:hypothetical protein
MGKYLQTTQKNISLRKYIPVDMTEWGLSPCQPFFPSLEVLFKTEKLSNFTDYGIKLDEHIDTVESETTIRTSKGNVVPVHRKTTMLLNPYKTMRGDYTNVGLPTRSDVSIEMRDNFQNPNNAAYVGALASMLLSQTVCENFPQVYGVYVGIAKEHTLDISDDYEEVSQKSWFSKAIGTTFTLKLRDGMDTDIFTHTRNNRLKLEADGDELMINDIIEIENTQPRLPEESHSPTVFSISSSGSKSILSTEFSEDENVFDIKSCDCMETENGEEEDVPLNDEEDEPFAWATFQNCPVITTIMEKCEGTLHELLEKEKDPEKQFAWFGQIIMALILAQSHFGLTHNDLHCNNVMYVSTEKEYMNYTLNNEIYSIPTFGYLMKIIDFERSIFSVRLAGMKHPKTFTSHQFHEDEEAGGQYNVEPYFNSKYPLIQPSPSFDLTRLATSLFWDLFPEGPYVENKNPLFFLFKEWMKLSDGTSVMFRKEGLDADHDRFHGFHLYRAIARYGRNAAIPLQQMVHLEKFKNSGEVIGDNIAI